MNSLSEQNQKLITIETVRHHFVDCCMNGEDPCILGTWSQTPQDQRRDNISLAMNDEDDSSNDEDKTCCLCSGDYTYYGNNPAPLNDGEGKCCDRCNQELVIPARMKLAFTKKE